jgi:DNA-binding transcriptional LysR family regulator
MQSTGALDLPGRLGRFHATHPAVQVRLRQAAAGSAGLAREVLAGALDLAVLSLPGPPPAGLTAWPVTEEPLLVVCQPGHPLASRHPVKLGRLAEEPFIDFPPGWGNRAVVDRAFATAGRERQVLFEVAGFGAAADLVRNGLGIAFLPASEAARTSDLAAVELSEPALIWRVSVAAPAHRRMPTAAQAFLDELLRDAPRRLTENQDLDSAPREPSGRPTSGHKPVQAFDLYV